MIHITGKEDKQTIDRSLKSYLSILSNRIQKSSINIDELKIDLRQAVADVDKLRSIVEGQRLLLLQVVDSEKSHFSSVNDHRYDDSLEYIRKVLEGVDDDLKGYAGDIDTIINCIGSCQSCQSTQTTCNTCNSSEQNVQPQPCNQTPTPCYDSCGACETSQAGCTFCNSGQTPQCKETYCIKGYAIDCTGCVSDYHAVCDHCFGTAYSDCWAEQLACPTYDPGCSTCQGNYHCDACVSTQTIPCTQNPGCEEDQMQECGTRWSNQICKSEHKPTCSSSYNQKDCPSKYTVSSDCVNKYDCVGTYQVCFSRYCTNNYSGFNDVCKEEFINDSSGGVSCKNTYAKACAFLVGSGGERCRTNFDHYCYEVDTCGASHLACGDLYYCGSDNTTTCSRNYSECISTNGKYCGSFYTNNDNPSCKSEYKETLSGKDCNRDYIQGDIFCSIYFSTCDSRNGNKTYCGEYSSTNMNCTEYYISCGGSNSIGCNGGYRCTGANIGCDVCYGTAYFCSSCYIQAVCSKCNTTQTCGNEEAVWTCDTYVRGRDPTGDWTCDLCYGGCETSWNLSDGCIAGVIPPESMQCQSCDHCEGCNTCQQVCYSSCFGCNTSCESCETSCQSGNSCGSCQSACQSGQSCNQSCSDTPKPPCEYTSCSSCVGLYSISCAGSSFGPCDQYTCNNCYRTTYSSCSNGY